MNAHHRTRHLNPRLGNYLAIFTSAFVSLVVLVLILAEMSGPSGDLRSAIVIFPVVALTLAACAAYCGDAEGYFVASRRVPAFFNGLAIATVMFGAVGLSGFAGSLFFLGFDALAFGVGMLLGLLALAILIAPYFRKFGGHTLAAYLGRRFESRRVRILATVTTVLPLLLVLTAELAFASGLVARFTGRDFASVLPILAVAIALGIGLGGMRGASATGAAGGVVMLLAIVVPIATVSVLLTNLPLAPFTYGATLDALGPIETALGLTTQSAVGLELNIPPPGVGIIAHPFLARFSHFGPTGFLLLSLTIMAGIASFPSIVARSATSPTVLQTRKSMGWATVTVAVVVLFLPAGAVFARSLLFGEITGALDPANAYWLRDLMSLGAVNVAPIASGAPLTSVLSVDRDLALVLLPAIAGLPSVMVDTVAAGLAAAAFVAASAHAHALGATLTDDLVLVYTSHQEHSLSRSVIARILGAAGIAVAAFAAGVVTIDPFRLMLMALTISGGSLFMVIVLSIWWKRFSADGATLALVIGFGLTSGYAILTDVFGFPRIFGLDPILFGAIAAILSGAAGAVASLIGPRPTQSIRDFVRDVRVPGGETVYDRELRLAEASRRRNR